MTQFAKSLKDPHLLRTRDGGGCRCSFKRTQNNSGTDRKNNRNGKQGRRSPAALSPELRRELERLVNRHIARQEELKVAYYQGTINVGGYNYTNWATNGIQMLTPYNGTRSIAIAQGTGQADRIGNTIRVKKALLKCTSWVMPYQAITNPTPTPLLVRMWIFTRKDYQNLPPDLSAFFQAGNSSTAPIGNILDYNYQINTDIYTVYKTVDFKLGYAAFVASPGGIGASGYYSNNDSEMVDMRTIDITPWYPKTVDWNDTTTIPFSKPVFFTIEAVAQDGTTQSSGTYGMQMNYQVILEYSDA